jgi:uncharacterized damage-inducible protein DinB
MRPLLADTFLPQFDHEMASTKRVLERVPAQRMDWKPHQKSWTLGELATHIATIPGWAEPTMTRTVLDLAPKPGEPPRQRGAAPAAAGALLDRNVAASRAAIAAAADANFLVPWTLKSGDATIFTMPRIAVLRSFVLSHLIHHRGEMMVYLRLCDVPLPAVYGPSADESA